MVEENKNYSGASRPIVTIFSILWKCLSLMNSWPVCHEDMISLTIDHSNHGKCPTLRVRWTMPGLPKCSLQILWRSWVEKVWEGIIHSCSFVAFMWNLPKEWVPCSNHTLQDTPQETPTRLRRCSCGLERRVYGKIPNKLLKTTTANHQRHSCWTVTMTSAKPSLLLDIFRCIIFHIISFWLRVQDTPNDSDLKQDIWDEEARRDLEGTCFETCSDVTYWRLKGWKDILLGYK